MLKFGDQWAFLPKGCDTLSDFDAWLSCTVPTRSVTTIAANAAWDQASALLKVHVLLALHKQQTYFSHSSCDAFK